MQSVSLMYKTHSKTDVQKIHKQAQKQPPTHFHQILTTLKILSKAQKAKI